MTNPRSKIYDPFQEERKQATRRLVFIALTVMTAVSMICDAIVDLFPYPAKIHDNGWSVTSQWDWATSLLFLVWAIVAFRMWHRNKG